VSKKAAYFGAEIIELVKKVVGINTELQIYTNGHDNLYPERIERVINASPTAKSATKFFRKYILGRGISLLNNVIINKEKQQTVKEYLKDLTDSYATQNGAFVRVMYDFEIQGETLEPVKSGLEVIPFGYCRLGKPDDKKYSGKIFVYEHWDEKQPKFDDMKAFNVYNPDPKVIKYQVNQCKGNTLAQKIKNYPGQIYFFNPENTIYPLAHIDQAFNDADSENRAAVYKNTILRKGFFGKTVVVTKPLMGSLSDVDVSTLEDEQAISEFHRAKSEADKTSETIKKFIGAENSDGILHLQLEPGDDMKMEDAFYVKNIESNLDDKLFEFTERSTANNIRKAVNCIPSILIERNDNAIFSQSGEALKQAQLSFQDQCEEDRSLIEGVNKKLFKGIKELEGKGTELELLIKVEEKPKEQE
jgi:hypothetical protein